MDRVQSLAFLKENLKSQNLIKHSLAVEAIMRSLARHFRQDEEKWSLVGLLHDIDYEKVKDDLSKHSLKGAEMLLEAGLPEDVCRAVRAHNDAHKIPLETPLEKAIYVVDQLSGLVVAATLVLPSKKLSDLTVENILNRMKEKSFAKNVDREVISKCKEYLNLPLEDFLSISLKGMQGISLELGL